MCAIETKRRVPYGVINWAELVRECFVVDNTRYIRELEQIKTPVFLRPKRFGKSVVCSMLAHYCDINLKDRLECDAVVSVQVYDGNLAPVVETDGYFDALIPFRRLLGL